VAGVAEGFGVVQVATLGRRLGDTHGATPPEPAERGPAHKYVPGPALETKPTVKTGDRVPAVCVILLAFRSCC
jgi:hypothetical protein